MDASPHSADIDLVRRAKAGDMEAFETLARRHERQVYALARRILQNDCDAEDVTQQTFLSVIEHLADFREEAALGTWIHRIATHAALKVLRKRKGLDVVSLDGVTDPSTDNGHPPHPEFIADWTTAPDILAAHQETRRLIDQALAELDEKHRLVFLLRDVEGFSVRETADTLGISEVNVKVRLLRARLQLRERLTQVFGDPHKAIRPGHDHSSGAPSPP